MGLRLAHFCSQTRHKVWNFFFWNRVWFAHTDLVHFHSTVLCYLNRRKIPFVFPRSTAQLNKIHFRHLSFHGNKWKWLSTSSSSRFHKPISSMAPNLIINTLKKTLPSCLWTLSIQLELTGWNFWLRESVNDILKLLVEVTQIVLKFSVHCLSLEPTWRSGDVYL